MRWWCIALCAVVAPWPAAMQAEETGNVRGRVRDADTGETLPMASVRVDSSRLGTTSDKGGYYLLQGLEEGSWRLSFSYVGYRSDTLSVKVTGGQTAVVDAELHPRALEGSEIEVTAHRPAADITPVGSFGTRVTEMARIPTVGQPDLLRSLQLLPGVQSASDNSAGLYVRGGTPGQNLILLDDVVVYNPNHMLGFFSTFNPDALKDVLLLKGTFPARYGDRLSSVLDITNLDGNSKSVTAKAAWDLISAGLTLEGPAGGSGSWMVSGRRTYQEMLKSPLFSHIVNDLFSTRIGTITAGPTTGGGFRGPGNGPAGLGFASGGFGRRQFDFGAATSSFDQDYGFYDSNFKLTLEPTDADRFSVSGYLGNDALDLGLPSFRNVSRNQLMDWGNQVGRLSWTHLFGSRLLGTATLSASRFASNFEVAEAESQLGGGEDGLRAGFSLDRRNTLIDLTAKTDFQVFLPRNQTLRIGGQVTSYDGAFQQGQGDSARGRLSASSGYQAAYAELDVQIGRLEVTPGLRASHFNRGSYAHLSPRVAGRYALSDRWRLKGGWGVYHQYINLITIESFSYSTDMWLPVGETVAPGKAVHRSAGFLFDVSAAWSVDVEAYHKDLDNLVEFRSQVRLDDSTPLSDLFLTGAGRSHGAEVLVRKTEGRMTGWIGYTLGKTEHTFPALNDGRPFPPTYDRRNDVTVVVHRQLGRRWGLNVNWVYGTGQAYTIPESQYTVVQPSGESISYVHVSGKNAYRLPDYHRLDAALTCDIGIGRAKGQIVLSVFNLYNRQNIWYRTFDVSEDEVQVQDVLMQPLLPSIGLRLGL